MRKLLQIIVILFLTVSITCAYVETTNLKGEFELVTHEGKKFTQDNLKNHYNLIYFGFTFCPDMCPSILNNFSLIYHRIPKELEKKLQIIFVSVDPSRDDIKRMKDYMSNFDNRMIGLTGTERQVERIANIFKVYYAALKNEKDPENYMVDHSSVVYFTNPNGELVYAFGHTDPSEHIAEEIIRIINQDKKK